MATNSIAHLSNRWFRAGNPDGFFIELTVYYKVNNYKVKKEIRLRASRPPPPVSLRLTGGRVTSSPALP
ncbi:MAG TPA: hypothetical protein DER10_11940 [Elusimicrobia bacterium]|nr:hypothetical protein [Elusimicrobiota bacterium]